MRSIQITIVMREFFTAGPALPVEDILLQQGEERFHRRVVTARADTAHRADEPMALEGGHELRRTDRLPLSECTIVPAGERNVTVFDKALTVSSAVIRDDIE